MSDIIEVSLDKNPRARPPKGLRERLSADKLHKTEAELLSKQEHAESRRLRELVQKSRRAAAETLKVETAQVQVLRAEASSQVKTAVKRAEAANRMLEKQKVAAQKTLNAAIKRDTVRQSAFTEQALRDRAQADLEASLIPVHALSR